MSEALPDDVVIDGGKIDGLTLTEPTAHLRFIERGGKRILQQQWESRRWERGVPTTWSAEWRDINLVETP